MPAHNKKGKEGGAGGGSSRARGMKFSSGAAARRCKKGFGAAQGRAGWRCSGRVIHVDGEPAGGWGSGWDVKAAAAYIKGGLVDVRVERVR